VTDCGWKYLLNKQMVVEGERAMKRICVTVFGVVVYCGYNLKGVGLGCSVSKLGVLLSKLWAML
jgi:hypothetical protein